MTIAVDMGRKATKTNKQNKQCIATDCMLGGQPNHGWQLCFPLLMHTGGSDQTMTFRLKDLSIDEMVEA